MSSTEEAARAPGSRSERRIKVHLPIVVRGTDQEGVRFEETTESQDLCRAGAAFVTVHKIDLGADLEIIIPLPKKGSESETNFATRGRVVHVAPGKGGHQRVVGVQFIGPRFQRVFRSESTA